MAYSLIIYNPKKKEIHFILASIDNALQQKSSYTLSRKSGAYHFSLYNSEELKKLFPLTTGCPFRTGLINLDGVHK